MKKINTCLDYKNLHLNFLNIDFYKKGFTINRETTKINKGFLKSDLGYTTYHLQSKSSGIKIGSSLATQNSNFFYHTGKAPFRLSILINRFVGYYSFIVLKMYKLLFCLNYMCSRFKMERRSRRILILNPKRGGFNCLVGGLKGFLPTCSLPGTLALLLISAFPLAELVFLFTLQNLKLDTALIRVPFSCVLSQIFIGRRRPLFSKKTRLKKRRMKRGVKKVVKINLLFLQAPLKVKLLEDEIIRIPSNVNSIS